VIAAYDEPDSATQALNSDWYVDESDHVHMLAQSLALDPRQRETIRSRAIDLVKQVRQRSEEMGAMEAFMQEYDLSSEEGVVLMCLAEALLRIPDSETAEKLISDKLSDADWESHLGKSDSLFVNASTWGLMLTGRLVRVGESKGQAIGSTLARLANRSGEPVIRLAIRQAMRIMGHQYVMGRTSKSALDRAEKKANRRFRYSFDMLGADQQKRAGSCRKKSESPFSLFIRHARRGCFDRGGCSALPAGV